MPYGLKRFQKAEALHFITFSCFHRLPFLASPEPKDTVEAALELIRARHQARIYAYVLMPEHVHLLINEPPSILLAQLLKALKQTTSRKLKEDGKRFWQERYFDRNIRGEAARSDPVYPPQSGEARTGGISRAVPMEQLFPLRHGHSGSG